MENFDKSKWKLDPSDFERNEKRTFKKSKNIIISFGIQKSTGRNCVLKRTNELEYSEVKRYFDYSIYVLAMNKYPAIVPFVGFYELNDFGYFIEEEISNGSLQSLLEINRKGSRNPLLDETHKLIISYGISCAMEHLHHNLITYKNMHCSNILLDSKLHPYLTDFGFSAKIGDPSNMHFFDTNTLSNFIMMYPDVLIKPPEEIEMPKEYTFTLPTDVFSYGITIYELISELKPFANLKTNYQICKHVIDGKRPPIPNSVPKNWANLIEKCWNQKPLERPTFTTICDILESDEFVNDRIDRQLFEDYKKLVKPFRPSSQKSDENEQHKEEQSDLISTIKKLEDELEKARSASFDPFEEQEKKSEPDENYFTDSDDQQFYQTVCKIDEGATSIVYKVIDTRTNQVLCKKVLKKTDEGSSFKNARNALKEFEVLRKIFHPCICKAYKINIMEPLKGDGEDQELTTISLYLEFLPRSLKESINENILDNTLKVRIAVEVAHALSFIHKYSMIHRDVKVENIMMNSVFEAKVVGFGLVRIDEYFSGQSFLTTSMTKGVGTLSYMSPEMLSEEEYDGKTDVYSYGIVLYYLLLGKMPKHNMKEKMRGIPIPFPDSLSSKITEFGKELITKCTKFDASDRPSFDEILKQMREHSFEIAPEIDQSIISKRDRELSFFESNHDQIK